MNIWDIDVINEENAMTMFFRDLLALAALGLFVAMVSLWSDLIIRIV